MLEERRLLTSIVVNSPSDATNLPNGLIDLRMAIAAANTATTPTTITFDPSTVATNHTILLSGTDLELTNTKEPITINGPAIAVTVNGKNLSQSHVFLIDAKVGATLTNLTITGGTGALDTDFNVEGIVGGGIENKGYGRFDQCDFLSGNSTINNFGGGIYNVGKMNLTNVTIWGNSANVGSGIYNDAGTMTLTNVTVSDNSSDGIFNQATMTLTNVTISGNGSGFSNEPGVDVDTVVIGNSIIAANGTDVIDGFGDVESAGFNLIGNTDGSTGWASTDLIGTAVHPLDPKLGPLANNGGPTQTMLPLAGSPAINHGSNALAVDPKGNKLTTDQRGLPRIVGGTVDIGAVEVQPSITVAPPPAHASFPPFAPLKYTAVAGQSTSLPVGQLHLKWRN